MEFWDPHFHIMDGTDEGAPLQSGCEASLMQSITPSDPNYRTARIIDELKVLDGKEVPLVYSGGCFVEVMSVCHAKTKNGEELNPLCVQEARWVERELPKRYFSCPSVQLQAKNAEATLAEVSRCHHVRGVRQILNYRAPPAEDKYRHPRNNEDLLENADFLANFGLLEKYDLHFECQLESPQFATAVELFSQHPKVPIVINHLGSPDLADIESDDTTYWKGMRQFAALPQCVIKLSMLCRVDKDWDTNEVVVGAVHKIIALFGIERCFFASNYPVDVIFDWPTKRLFPAFLKLASKYTAGEQRGLFAENARRAYRAEIFATPQQLLVAHQARLNNVYSPGLTACFSRSVTILVKDVKTQSVTIYSGHSGVTTYYESIAKASKTILVGKGEIHPSGVQYTVTLQGEGEGAMQVEEVHSIDDTNHIIAVTAFIN